MSVKKLYQSDVYMKTSSAVISGIAHVDSDTAVVYLDQTIFFPEGGGQSCDSGYISGLEVIDVQEAGDDIAHTVRLNPDARDSGRPAVADLAAGQQVSCVLDWSRRFDNMQRHCGEHILSGMFDREYGGVNRGFHMGSDYMTVDISLEKDPQYRTLTYDMALHAEQCANEAIWQDLPVIIRRFDSREDAAGLPLRKPLTIESDISIVSVGSIDDPSDCVACCGTHPSTSGQVGLVKVFKVEKNKDMFRVYFEAGQRALRDYGEKHSLITELGNMFSAGTDDLLAKVKKQEEKNQDVRNELASLKRVFTAEKAAAVAASAEGFFTLEHIAVDDAMRIGKDTAKPLLALLVPEAQTLLLFSDGSTDCAEIVSKSGLKGGGKSTSARAIGDIDALRKLARGLFE